MFITKHIEKKINVDYFFIEGTIQIDSNYFINKIESSINSLDNLNYKTNIKDKMTPFKFFNNDSVFLDLLPKFIDYIDENIVLQRYRLLEAWGFRVGHGGRTTFHNHIGALWSGAIYLNDHEQTLDFPAIDKKVKPADGRFVLFSSFLEHGCKKNLTHNYKYGLSFNMSECGPL